MNEQMGAICVAVYRPDPELLAIQLASIADQTLRAWTCYVVIDGHDPATASVVEGLVSGDERFVVHHHEVNVGFYRNFQRAVAEVSPACSWVALADQDDFWLPTKLERLVQHLSRPGVSAAVGQAHVTDKDGTILTTTARRRSSHAGLFFNNQVTGSMAVFRRDVISIALPFPEPTDAAYHDHWLGVCAQALGTIFFDDQVLQHYVQHGQNVLGEERGMRLLNRFRRLARKSSGIRGVAHYLADHRWGWRVRMARELLDRMPSVNAPYAHIAAGRPTPTLIIVMLSATWRKELPVGRFIGLLIGAIAWRGRHH